MKLHLLSLIVAGSMLSAASVNSAMPKLNLDIEQITVSGLSSGGFMATQMQLAFGEWVSGAGIVAAGPYYCARNSLPTALQECLTQTSVDIDIDAIDEQISQWQAQGKVADLSTLSEDKVWLLHGTQDKRLSGHVAGFLNQQYQRWVKEGNLVFISDKPFAHHMPTLSDGALCDTSEPPFLGRCDYDAAGEMLTHLYGELDAPSDASEDHLIAIEQHVWVEEAGGSLAESGFAYVPVSCQQGESCQVHVSFHGCNQFVGADGVDKQYVLKAGFNRWAESNHLVVLYPQTQASNISPFNPQGCWDWWGYTGADYATREGVQLKAVKALVMKLAGDL